MNAVRLASVALVAGLIALASPAVPMRAARAAELPPRLTDQEFWGLTEHFSVPGGSFRSDNFLSNERGY
jgi:hypothetical protein